LRFCFPCNVSQPRCARPALPASGLSRSDVPLDRLHFTQIVPASRRPCGFCRRRAQASHPGSFVHRDVLASPRGPFVHGFFKYCASCSVTDPPPGVVAAWPNLLPSITARRSGNVHGVRSVLAALRSFDPATTFQFRRVLTCSQATIPHAVEPRAARDVFDVRHRCPEPANPMLSHIRLRAWAEFSLRLLGFCPAGQPFRQTGAAPPRLGTKGPHQLIVRCCLGLFLFQVSRPPDPALHFWRPIRSWALTSRRSARCATASDDATDSAECAKAPFSVL
jgi:hypothetical protein